MTSPASRPPAPTKPFGTLPSELAPFQDEPRQMRSGTVGKTGVLHLGLEYRYGRTVLAMLERRSPCMVQRVLYCDEQMPSLAWIFVITSTGCLVQGDRMAVDIDLGAGAQAHVTTQAATRVHGMDANYAAQVQSISVSDGAYLELLPEPIIPHRGARFVSETRIIIAPTATMLWAEIIRPGRKHHHPDERFGASLMSMSVEAARPDGRRLFAERLLIEPDRYPVRQTGVMDSFDVLGSVILCTPKAHADRVHERVQDTMGLVDGLARGASRLPNDAGLIYRVLGRDTAPVRASVREFWKLVRNEVIGAAIPPPFLWR